MMQVNTVNFRPKYNHFPVRRKRENKKEIGREIRRKGNKKSRNEETKGDRNVNINRKKPVKSRLIRIEFHACKQVNTFQLKLGQKKGCGGEGGGQEINFLLRLRGYER